MIPLACAAALYLAAFQPPPNPDILLADFEGPTYGDWTPFGVAFGQSPARGTLPNQMHVSGFRGSGLVNSFRGGDSSVGTLTSPQFTISRTAITFLIGGGGWPGKTCMNLVVGDKIIRTAVGPNTQDGGSEALERMNWDVSDLMGQSARIEIVDNATRGWGHINVDDIVLTDHPPPGVEGDAVRTLEIEHKYLNLPIRNDAPLRRLSLEVDGKNVNDFEAALSENEPDFWAFLDVSAWTGKLARLRAERIPTAALARVEPSDDIIGSAPLYREPLRPQFHFSTRRGWTNDPNGLVYSGGEYHLFYQHNPFGWTSRNMHWGHAVSPDLVHWNELPTALAPHSFGDWVWSGSAVVDAANTSGCKSGPDDPLVVAFTSTGRGECIAVSTDRARTFHEIPENPVVRHQGRDPRLLWHEATHRWVMAVYDERPAEPVERDRQGVAFYTSSDLRTWTYRSRIGDFYECPDIFPLHVDSPSGPIMWVLTAANSEYMLGQFDGERFTPDPPHKLPGNRGDRFYAAQTFSNAPEGRRIQIGWGQIDSPGMPFNQMMSFPCELTLRTTPQGVRLFSWPVREIELLRARSWSITRHEISPDTPLRCPISAQLLDISAEIDLNAAAVIDFAVRNMHIRVDVPAHQLSCAGRTVPFSPREGHLSLRVLTDRTSIEVFAAKGEIAMLMAGQYQGDDIILAAEGGAPHTAEFTVRELRSAWPDTLPTSASP